MHVYSPDAFADDEGDSDKENCADVVLEKYFSSPRLIVLRKHGTTLSLQSTMSFGGKGTREKHA